MLESIYTSYSLINRWFDTPGLHSGYNGAVPWNRLRELNDYAYYVLIFAQLEELVSFEFECKRDHDFEIQRLQSGKVDFMRKVFIVFENYPQTITMIEFLYDLRNAIAHGDVKEGLFEKFGIRFRKPITTETLYNFVTELINRG